MVGEPVPCALVVVMLELLGAVKLELLVVVKMELVVVKLEPVVTKLELVAAMLELVAAMLEPLVAMLELVVTGPPVDNLEPVEFDVPALVVKQAIQYLVCATEW